MMKKFNKKYFQEKYLLAYKSVNWWEEEVGELVSFFENLDNKKLKHKYSKRILEHNVNAYTALCGRGDVEAKILDEIEKEFKKYNASKKKK